MRLKSLFTHVCTPDALDMIDHYQTRAERLADLWVHVTGLSLAGVGGIVLAVLAAIYGGPGAVVATAIYAVCLIAMLTVSTIYNWTNPCAARPVLRRMDEAAIFLMIAGSYTPFTTQRFEGDVVDRLHPGGLADRRRRRRHQAGRAAHFRRLLERGLCPVRLAGRARPEADAGNGASDCPGPAGAGRADLHRRGLRLHQPAVKFRRAIWHGFVVAGAGVHWVAVLLGVVLAPQMA
jgi:hemolysin III